MKFILPQDVFVTFDNVDIKGPGHMKTCLRAHTCTDSEGPDQPPHPRSLITGLYCSLTESLPTTECTCINGEQKQGMYIAHAQMI